MDNETTWDEIVAGARERLATTSGDRAPSEWAARTLVALEALLSHGWVLHSPWSTNELVSRYAAGLTVELPPECDDESVPSFWTVPCLDGCSGSGTIRWHINAGYARFEVVTSAAFALIDVYRGCSPRLRWWVEHGDDIEALGVTATWAQEIFLRVVESPPPAWLAEIVTQGDEAREKRVNAWRDNHGAVVDVSVRPKPA